MLTVLISGLGCCCCRDFQIRLGAPDCAPQGPELAFASWPIGHLFGSASHISLTARAKTGRTAPALQHKGAHTEKGSCPMGGRKATGRQNCFFLQENDKWSQSCRVTNPHPSPPRNFNDPWISRPLRVFPENATGGCKTYFSARGAHIVLQLPPSKGPDREEIVSQGGHRKWCFLPSPQKGTEICTPLWRSSVFWKWLPIFSEHFSIFTEQ